MEITPIAHFKSPFTSKFGIPKQSGLAKDLPGRIVFEPAYRNADALRGLEGFTHLWMIWQFSANAHKANSPVVRPPVLGGNEALGVFATRSPYRPNPIGLSCVRIDHIDLDTKEGPRLPAVSPTPALGRVWRCGWPRACGGSSRSRKPPHWPTSWPWTPAPTIRKTPTASTACPTGSGM